MIKITTRFWQAALGVHAILLALSLSANDAQTLLAEFQADRNAAYKQYRGQEMSVSGRITRSLKALGGMEITLDDAVTVKLGREHSELVEQIDAAARAENDRVDQAREWRNQYERKRRKSSGGKKKKGGGGKPYNDSMNPHGAPKENLNLSLSATGTCKGMRSSKILLQPVSVASLAAATPTKKKGKAGKKGKVAKKNGGGKSPEMAAALKRDSWKLKGIVYVENGQRYFAADKDQYGVDVWPITLPPAVGNQKVTAAMNGKKAEINVSFKAMARGNNGIRVDDPKVQSLNLQ